MTNIFLKPYKGFGLSTITQGYTDLHHAIDSLPVRSGLVAYGTPLVCPEKVTVTKIYGNEYTPYDDAPLVNGYGLWMQGESGYMHLYWHCQPVFPVSKGDVLERGTIVGYVGDSGNVMTGGIYVPTNERDHAPFLGTHLHQAMVDERPDSLQKGYPVNPIDFIDLDTEPSYGAVEELAAIAVTLSKIASLLKP